LESGCVPKSGGVRVATHVAYSFSMVETSREMKY
jgi:hypothetical protein